MYRARDTKLHREVAIKVLPAEFALDPDRLARFSRQAQVPASLNHPHIAAIHGLEESNHVQALILELVEGETLGDRIANGPLALDEALTIAGQIAEALAAAHEAGIIHRDLKPANIKVRSEEDIDIFDTMNAAVKSSNGVNMSYSANAFMPVEGYYLAVNGTKGRLEVRDYERQAWEPGEETAMYVMKNFGTRVKVELPRETEGHGGGDQRLRDLIFRKIDAPAHMWLPDSRAGAMSCLTGIAARKSIDEGRPIKIADLVKVT